LETALGDYLEALCVDELDAVADVSAQSAGGPHLAAARRAAHDAVGENGMLSGVVSGPAAIVRLLSHVRLAETLSAALQSAESLADDESVITRSGEWIGRDWLRVNRGGDPHSGVLEREQRVKQLKVELAHSEENTREMETLLATCRTNLALRNGSATKRRAASRVHIANTRICSASSKVSVPVRRNRRCGANASRKRPRKLVAKSVSGRTHWPAQGLNSTAAWKLSLSSIRAAPVSKTNAKNAVKPCRVRAHVRRRPSSPVAIC
jgi:chromosome segregation protein